MHALLYYFQITFDVQRHQLLRLQMSSDGGGGGGKEGGAELMDFQHRIKLFQQQSDTTVSTPHIYITIHTIVHYTFTPLYILLYTTHLLNNIHCCTSYRQSHFEDHDNIISSAVTILSMKAVTSSRRSHMKWISLLLASDAMTYELRSFSHIRRHILYR